MAKVTVAASLAVDIVAYLRTRGFDAVAVCQRAGVDPHLRANTSERISGAIMAALWREAIAESGDPDLALHTSVTFEPGALDIVGYVMLSSHTAGDAIRRGARLIRLLNDGLAVDVDHGPHTTVIRLRVLAPSDPLFVSASRHVAEAVLGGTVHQLRLLTGQGIMPDAVRMSHPVSPAGSSEHARLFGVAPRFSADENAIDIRTRDLDIPLRSANPALLAAFDQHATAALAALDSRASLVGRVNQELVTQMKGEAPTITMVARALAMSARNLQRGLAAEGTTFQVLLDDARRELAVRHLSEPNATVAKVAWLVGFSEPSAFHRAFRRWTGHSPRAVSVA
jgi:AraC-like DNA-binding protein